MTNYLTIRDAAAALSVSVNTVRAMLHRLGAVDLKGGAGKNRMIRIPEDRIAEYLTGCGIHAPAPATTAEARTEPAQKKPFRLERR